MQIKVPLEKILDYDARINGCMSENQRIIVETNEKRVRLKRSFCREELPDSDKEQLTRLKKRMEWDDAEAVYDMACNYQYGKFGLPKDERKAFELYLRTARLGSSNG